MTQIDQTSLSPACAPDAADGGGSKKPGAAPQTALRLRVSITADDVALLPLYEALLKLPSDKARRLHIRQILLQSLMPAIPATRTPPQATTPGQAPRLPIPLASISEVPPKVKTPGAGKKSFLNKLDID